MPVNLLMFFLLAGPLLLFSRSITLSTQFQCYLHKGIFFRDKVIVTEIIIVSEVVMEIDVTVITKTAAARTAAIAITAANNDSVCYVPGTVLSTLCEVIRLILTIPKQMSIMIMSTLDEKMNAVYFSLSNLFKVTWLVKAPN